MTILDGTITEAIEMLAKRAADLRTRPALTEKRAAGMGEFLRPLGDALGKNPELGGALLGGGLGAVGGGLHASIANRQRDPADRKSVLGSALTGGLAGGALGGGAGLAYRGLQHFAGPQGIGHGDALQSNEFVDPETGQRMQIDAAALKSNPDLPRKLRELGTSNISTTAGRAALAGLQRLHDVAPVSTTAAGIAAPIDALLHNPLFGIARRSAENISGKIGRNLLSRGAEASKDMSSVLRDAIMKNTATGGTAPVENPPKTPGGSPTIVPGKRITAAGKTSGKGVLEILGGKSTRGKGIGTALEVVHAPTEELERHTGSPGDITKQKITQPKEIKSEKMNWGELGQLKAKGQEGSRWADRQLYRVPGTNFSYAGAKSLGRAMGGRAALYGLPIAGEWLLRGGLEDIDKHDQIRQLVSQYAKPVR